MGRKKKVSVDAVESVAEADTRAGAVLFKTYSDFIESHTSNWAQLTVALDAALTVKFKEDGNEDAADAVIEGIAVTFMRDLGDLYAFFAEMANIEEVEETEYNFVKIPGPGKEDIF